MSDVPFWQFTGIACPEVTIHPILTIVGLTNRRHVSLIIPQSDRKEESTDLVLSILPVFVSAFAGTGSDEPASICDHCVAR
jgi:hypothetical protein